MKLWPRDESYEVAFTKAMEKQIERASIEYVGRREPGLYWLVELYTPGSTMYCQIPPRRGFPCGFTHRPNDAYVWKSKWAAQFVAWRLARGGKFNCRAASHIWMQ